MRASFLGCRERRGLTDPLVEPSWEDFPLTLKLTPLGAFDLISKFAVESSVSLQRCQLKARCPTRGRVVKVFVDELKRGQSLLQPNWPSSDPVHRWMLLQCLQSLEEVQMR